MTITTEDAEAFARQLDANEPSVSDPVAIEFFGDVATALRALAEQRDTACRASAAASRARGEAEGKLAASEMAGVVEGWKARVERAERAETRALAQAQDWKARAQRAEAEAERLRDAVTAAIIAYEHDIVQGVEPSEDRRRVIAALRAALEGGKDADQQTG